MSDVHFWRPKTKFKYNPNIENITIKKIKHFQNFARTLIREASWVKRSEHPHVNTPNRSLKHANIMHKLPRLLHLDLTSHFLSLIICGLDPTQPSKSSNEFRLCVALLVALSCRVSARWRGKYSGGMEQTRSGGGEVYKRIVNINIKGSGEISKWWYEAAGKTSTCVLFYVQIGVSGVLLNKTGLLKVWICL